MRPLLPCEGLDKINIVSLSFLASMAVYVEPSEALPYDGNITDLAYNVSAAGECTQVSLSTFTLFDGKMAVGEEDRDELIPRDA